MTKTIELTHPSKLRAKRQDIWASVESEMKRAKKKYKSFPDHPAAQAGVVVKQSGELMAAALDLKYQRGGGKYNDSIKMRKSAVKTIVAAILLLENM